MVLPLIALGVAAAAKGAASYYGSKKAQSKAERAAAAAKAAYDEAVADAKRHINTGYESSEARIAPYAESGTRAHGLLSDAVGVNGRPAQQGFFDSFEDDPGFNATLAAGREQVEHSATFAGRGNSGATMKDLQDYGQRQKHSQFQDRLRQLAGLSDRGWSASSTLSSNDIGRGNTLADIALKQGSFAAGTQQNLGQLAASGVGQRAGIVGDTIGSLASAFGGGFGGGSLGGFDTSTLVGAGGRVIGSTSGPRAPAGQLPWQS